MVESSLHWRSSNGVKATAPGKLRSFAIPVVPQVCLYATIQTRFYYLLILRKQKGVMISHRNVIANVLQMSAFEKPHRDSLRKPGSEYDVTEVVLGLLPQSHIYSLVVICHSTTYRGDQVINLPKFEVQQFLGSIQRFKINSLFLVSHSISHFMSRSLLCRDMMVQIGFKIGFTIGKTRSSLAEYSL